MNRLVTHNTDGVTPGTLPPRQREQGKTRILFISSVILGFKRYAESLERFTADRDDIDAVHVRIRNPFPMRVASMTWPLPRGWDFHSYRYLMLSDWYIRRWFRSAIDPDRFDLIHWITQGNARPINAIKRRSKVRHAVNIDTTSILDLSEYGYSPLARKPFIREERRIFDLADAVVCRNHWATQSLRDDFNLPESKIIAAPNSIDLPEAHRWDNVDRGVPHDSLPRLVFVGNDWARKGADMLLRVHQQRFAGRAELHFIGDRHERDDNAKNVVWHGRQDHLRVRNELLPSMDVFVFPTVEDMMPWATIEAAGAGLPSIASRVAAIPDVILHEQTGLLHPPRDEQGLADAIETMISDPALREQYGRAARAHIEQGFNASRTYPMLLDRLCEIAGG